MIGIVMAGGKGTRMKNLVKEKLLLEYNQPIILNVIDALNSAKCFSKIVAITSNNSPETKNLLKKTGIELFDSTGNGYVEDLNHFLKTVNDSVFVTSGDLPLLDSKIVRTITSYYNHENIWTSILVTKDFLASLKISSEYEIVFENQSCCYTGISLINTQKISDLNQVKENFIILNDKRIGFNMNTKEDFDLLGTA